MSALPGSEPAVFAFGPFVLDRDRRLLARDGAAVAITPKAFDLLVALVERGGAAVSKDELMAALWPDTAVEEGNLTFQISTLRKALGADGGRFIATLPGRGYQFVAPLRRQRAVEPVVEPVAEPVVKPAAAAAVAESTWSKWIWAAALALLVLGALVAAMVVKRDPPSPAGIRSLAVLPFKPLVATQRDEALELGIADTLITRLSHIPGVVVRPIGAVRRYSKLDDDPLAAARDLGVDAVLDGSVQREGSRVRVTVRLLRTSDGRPLWATQLDDSRRDLFAIQDFVADHVARAVVPALSPAAQAQLARQTTDDLEAYELYLKGRYWLLIEPARAEDFFRQAIARDPRFAAAYAAIAESWLFRGRFSNASPRTQFEAARAAALKAVEIDPSLGEAHAALAQVYGDHDWDWARADEEYRRALRLNPSSDTTHGQYAYLRLFRRDFRGALEHIERAVEIDPVSPLWQLQRGFILGCAGRHEEAIATLTEARRAQPRSIPLTLHLGMAYTNAGQPERGLAMFEEALQQSPGETQLLALQAWATARAGRREEALGIVRDVERRAARQPVAAPNLALAWTALGDHDRAFAWLDRALEQRLFLARIVTVHPGFAPLRADPRYAEVLRKLGM